MVFFKIHLVGHISHFSIHALHYQGAWLHVDVTGYIHMIDMSKGSKSRWVRCLRELGQCKLAFLVLLTVLVCFFQCSNAPTLLINVIKDL